MARPPKEFIEAAKPYVCVRVTNMAGVDLSSYRFDYDLTFAVLLMHGDGTVYHRYGTRDETSGSSRLSMPSLLRLLRETLEDHAEYQKKPSPPEQRPRRIIEEIPPMARKLKKEKMECFHCHMVNDADRDYAREEKRWSREATLSMWPLPEKVGVKLDVDDQVLVKGVAPSSPADKAGVRAGDRLLRAGGQRLRTQADLQWVLDNAPLKGAVIPLEYTREGESRRGEIRVEEGWKVASEIEFSWRASMWGMRPRPGYGGERLAKEDVAKLGLEPGTFAIKIGYIVDWGDEAYTGKSVRQAGLKKGDVVLAAGGRKDFTSELHFQSWFRFTQKPGTKIDLDILRDGKRLRIELPVLE